MESKVLEPFIFFLLFTFYFSSYNFVFLSFSLHSAALFFQLYLSISSLTLLALVNISSPTLLELFFQLSKIKFRTKFNINLNFFSYSIPK